MGHYFIIADDMTGANDSGVQLKRRGLSTVVTLHPTAIGQNSNSYVLNTETRAHLPADAYQITSEALAQIDLTRFQQVIKKVDSTLRGNVAEEIYAADQALHSELVIFMPALPDLGRKTKNAVQLLHGIPISETEMAEDPKTPVTEDNLQKLLQSVYDEPIIHYGISDISSGQINLQQGRIFTFDASSNFHMQEVVRTALQTNKRILWVGSAAIVEHLLEVSIPQKPALALIGSLSEISREQVHYAMTQGASTVIVPTHNILTGLEQEDAYIQEVVTRLKNGEDVMILSLASYDRSHLRENKALATALNLTPLALSQKTQELLGRITSSALACTTVSGIFMTGGDAAMGVFDQIGASSFRICAEVSLGIPLMEVTDGKYKGLKVITKAGAFGKPDAISSSFRKLKEV